MYINININILYIYIYTSNIRTMNIWAHTAFAAACTPSTAMQNPRTATMQNPRAAATKNPRTAAMQNPRAAAMQNRTSRHAADCSCALAL